jgi:uncharacterized protein (TIGR02300 family)
VANGARRERRSRHGLSRGSLRGASTEESVVKPELGTKRICPNCGSRYYDLHRDPIICPKCGSAFDPEALLKTRRTRVVAAPIEEEEVVEPASDEEADPDAEAEEAEVDPEDEDAAAAEGEDAEEEEEIIEDASELGEDEDDMAEVIENVDDDEER